MRARRTCCFLPLIVMLLAGCSESENGPAPGPAPTVTQVSGAITMNRTWRDTVRVIADADIGAGVQVSLAAAAVLEGADEATLLVHGSLLVEGTAQRPVTVQPMAGAFDWGGIVVESGSVAQIEYANSTGASLTTNGGQLILVDSVILGPAADLVIASGGTVSISYCNLGSQATSQHGDLYISNATELDVVYSNIAWAVFGFMIGGTTQASLNFNNFLSNDTDVSVLSPNGPVDMSSNHWDSGVPFLPAGFVINNPAPSPIAGAGPRQ